jgi:hypothetical protein
MQRIQQRLQVNNDGIVQIQLPKELINSEVDLVIVYQPVSSPKLNQELASLYGACADDLIVVDDEGISDAMDDDLIGVFDS